MLLSTIPILLRTAPSRGLQRLNLRPGSQSRTYIRVIANHFADRVGLAGASVPLAPKLLVDGDEVTCRLQSAFLGLFSIMLGPPIVGSRRCRGPVAVVLFTLLGRIPIRRSAGLQSACIVCMDGDSHWLYLTGH